jgi:hypothetical protein
MSKKEYDWNLGEPPPRGKKSPMPNTFLAIPLRLSLKYSLARKKITDLIREIDPKNVSVNFYRILTKKIIQDL